MREIINQYKNIQNRYAIVESEEADIIMDLVEKLLGVLEVVSENHITTGEIVGFDSRDKTVSIQLDNFEEAPLVIGGSAEISIAKKV